MSNYDKVHLDVKCKLKLFDSLITPILMYGCEIWGVYNLKEVDKLHYRFCKHILGVKPQTSNSAVLGELGRYPLSVRCKERALKYWTKIMRNTDNIIHMLYLEQLQNIHVNRNTNWAVSLHKLLDDLGFTNVHTAFNGNVNYLPMFKQRLCDQYIQVWNTLVTSQPKLDSYVLYKKDFKYEKYLDIVSNDYMRKEMSRLRLSSHSLLIETGRYNNVVRNLRLCKCCNLNVVESEFHFMLCCPLYRNLRQKYCINVSFPTKQKFNMLMSCNSNKTIRNISRFIHHAMLTRQEKLKTIPAS